MGTDYSHWDCELYSFPLGKAFGLAQGPSDSIVEIRKRSKQKHLKKKTAVMSRDNQV